MNRTPRTQILTIAAQVLLLIAVALLGRIAILAFGQLAALGWARAGVSITNPFAVPLAGLFGLYPMLSTPFAGVLDVNAGLTFFLLLIGRWVLAAFERRMLATQAEEQ